ncbi:MAG: 4-hydroxy-tetrahydrodipicolinate reductase [Coriobacteriales bacterium]|jgi:4-hydroxy-tetrahydrodipicolinate reductase|nr:4-hydroxy-tetrahydrodipicolinate reductase [Coriobacteriales bacterium]
MPKVLFNGYLGRMGRTVVPAFDATDDIEVVGVCDISSTEDSFTLPSGRQVLAFNDLATAVEAVQPTVFVDFTQPSALVGSLRVVLPLGVNCVVGTTGTSPETFAELIQLAPEDTTLFCAPNFAMGAVLMMAFARQAAAFFSDVEVIEFHHNGKKDAPSGTAVTTARQMAAIRADAGIQSASPGAESELEYKGARGGNVDGIPVHAVRAAGFVASQEVIFASLGETLRIVHDNIDRTSYLPGILLAVRSVEARSGLIIGLEALLNL